MIIVIDSSEKTVLTDKGREYVEINQSYTLANDHVVISYRYGERSHCRLPAGSVIKKIKAGDQCLPSKWEVKLP